MSIKLLNLDVALQHIPSNVAKGGLIHIEEDMDDVVKFYKVVAKSPRVDMVEVGDMVIAPWTKVTNPITAPINGVETQIHITSIMEVLGVVEND